MNLIEYKIANSNIYSGRPEDIRANHDEVFKYITTEGLKFKEKIYDDEREKGRDYRRYYLMKGQQSFTKLSGYKNNIDYEEFFLFTNEELEELEQRVPDIKNGNFVTPFRQYIEISKGYKDFDDTLVTLKVLISILKNYVEFKYKDNVTEEPVIKTDEELNTLLGIAN